MAKRLTAKAIRYAMGHLKKGASSSVVASEIGVTPRHVRRLWAEFRATGSPHVPKTPGRPTAKPSPDEVQLVLGEHKREDMGVVRVAMNLRKSHDISYSKVYRIMKEGGLVAPSTAKSRRRKWIRYERKHSNSMWHTDWHVMKDPRFRGLHLITYLDDASRCVTCARLFKPRQIMQSWRSGRPSRSSEPLPPYCQTTGRALSAGAAARRRLVLGLRPYLRMNCWTWA